MRLRGVVVLSSVVALLALGQSPAGAAPPPAPLPSHDPFYSSGLSASALAALKPGAIIKSRSVDYQPSGLPSTTLVKGVQLLYRTTTQLGKPTTTVTSLLVPTKPTVPGAPVPSDLVSDQWFYDALGDKCDPSYYLHNDGMSGGGTNSIEGPKIVSLLAQGYAVVTSDYEGSDLAWTAGPQSGQETLDGIQAALNYQGSTSPTSTLPPGLPSNTKVALTGYSGGAIASEWAAELAAKYAPKIASRIVGTAIGGVYVYPYHNLQYVSGSPKWSGVMPGGLLGASRGFKLDELAYASSYGTKLAAQASDACIDELLGNYPGLTFAQLVKPQYADFTKVPAFVKLNNKLIMSTGGTPTAPMYIAQGIDPDPSNAQTGEGTQPSPKYGPGDGVMLAGDTRSLARTYCARGVAVDYETYPSGHTDTFAPFFSTALTFLAERFNPVAPPIDNCSTIKPGNSLAPLPTPKAVAHSTSAPASHHSSSSAHNAATAGSDADPIANTGTPAGRLLLWATLLLLLGGALLRAARRPQVVAVAATPVPRPRPRPYPAADPARHTRRPRPYPRG